MTSFDVLSASWLPVIDREGQVEELGILPLLAKAHQLVQIMDPSPPIQFGLHRLLITFVMDAFQIRSIQDIETVLKKGYFDSTLLETYTTQCGDRFDLFSKTAPFLQSAPIAEEVSSTTSIAELVQHLPSGTNLIHFHHCREDDQAFSPPVCARLLTAIAPFMTAGGRGKSPSINGTPPWYVLIRGDNLFETIVLNCCGMPMPWAKERGVPAWRTDDRVVPKQEVSQIAVMDGLTWRPRFVRLKPSDPGRCTYTGRESPVLVKELVFSAGLKSRNQGSWRDFQVAYKITEQGRLPVLPRRGQEIWRDIGPLALLHERDYLSEDGKVRYERPLVTTQFAILQDDRILESARPLEFECYGMCTDKMKIFEWQIERLVIPSTILKKPTAGFQVQKAIDLTQRVGGVMERSIKTAYPRSGKANSKAFGGRIIEARHQYWSRLRPRFDREFLDSIAKQDDNDLDAADHLRAQWFEILRAHALDALNSVIDPLDADADSFRRQVGARDTFWRRLNKIKKSEFSGSV